MKNKILIIGVSGFLGFHLALKLAKKYKVVGIDIKKIKEDKNFPFKYYNFDISKKNEFKKIFEKERPDFVYHLAGPIALREDINSLAFKRGLNVLENLYTILDCSLKYNVQKIVFFSSGGAIYEKAKIMPTPESYNAHPLSLYGIMSLAIEKYIEKYGKENNLNFSILRFSNVYGPKQWKSGIIPSIVNSIIKENILTINGDGEQTRDFIYIDDAVLASIMVLKDKKSILYNAGSKEEISINSLIKKIEKVLNKKAKTEYILGKKEEIERSCLDISKIKKEIKWKPKMDIEKGLKKTIDSIKEENNLK